MNEVRNPVVASLDEARKRKAAESIVICLACAAAYQKPAGSGTLIKNPGCPTCGYVGWIGVARLTRRGAAASRGPSRVGADANRVDRSFQTDRRQSLRS